MDLWIVGFVRSERVYPGGSGILSRRLDFDDLDELYWRFYGCWECRTVLLYRVEVDTRYGVVTPIFFAS